jgi:ABC-type transport system substrate-binding protein
VKDPQVSSVLDMRRKTTLFVLAFMVSAMAFSVVPATTKAIELHPFIYASTASPAGIDPLGVYDTSSGLILTNVVETLFKFDYSDPSMPSIPLLAVDMGTWNTNKTEWTIDLHDNVTWHDGTPFTASDVVWNFERLNYMTEMGICEHSVLWFNDAWVNETAKEKQLILKEIVAIDSDTVKFVLNKRWLDFEALLPFWGAGLIKPTTGFEHEIINLEDIDLLIGTGPFMLDSVTINEKSVLTRYEKYWRPYADFQQVIIQVFDSGASSAQALYNKEVHLIRSIPIDDLEIVDSIQTITYKKVKSSCCFGFHLGMNVAWHARKAMQFAFNYSYLIKTLFEDTVFEIHTPVPDGMFGHNPNIPGLPYYNVTKAREFLFMADSPYLSALATAGLTMESPDLDWITCAEETPIDTFNFTCYSGSAGYQNILNNFAWYVGMTVTLNNRGDWSTFLDYCDENENLGITMLGWCPDYFAAVNQIEPLFATGASSNWNRLANETVDAAISALHSIPQGPALQTAIDEVVSMIIVENAAAMYYEQSAEYVAYSNWFIDDDSTDDLWNAQLDKYFYNMKWNRLNIDPSWWAKIGDTTAADDDDTTPRVPGYAPGILMAVAVGASVYLMLRKRK